MTTSGSQSGDSVSTVRDRAHHMAGQVVDKVQETAGRLAGTSQDNGGTGGGDSTPVMEKATEQVTSRLDMGKEYVAEAVTGVAKALRQTGHHLREEGAQPALAQYADRGAEQIENFSGYLNRRDTNQIITDVEGFARRQPVAFAGGAFALGMLAVRFLRSKNQPQGQSTASSSSSSYGNSYGGSSPSTPPTTGRPGSGSTSTPPGGYTAAARAALDRTPTSPLPPSAGSGADSTMNPGTPAAPGPGARTPGTQTERPTPRPTATPSFGGTSAGPGTQTGGSSSSERTGPGTRSQP